MTKSGKGRIIIRQGGEKKSMEWEVSLIKSLQDAMGKAGEVATKVFSTAGGEIITLVVLLAIMFCWSKAAGKRSALRIIAASLWFPMIKNAVLRMRPYMEHEEIRVLLAPEADAELTDVVQQGYSFPSGHSALSATIYGSICREAKKKWLWIASMILVALIGISRFLAGVHYPTDVLGGWTVALAAIAFGDLMEKYVRKEWVRYMILLAIALPGLIWCRSRDYFSALGMLIGLIAVFPYEEKYVRYKDTRNIWAMILRVAGAMAVYLVLDKVLKMPFSKDFLNDGTLGSGLVRAARNAIILFVLFGVYPRVFPLFEKIGKKGSK